MIEVNKTIREGGEAKVFHKKLWHGMDIISLIILAVVGNQLRQKSKQNRSMNQSREFNSSGNNDDLERKAMRQHQRREVRTPRDTPATEPIEVMSESTIYACLQLVNEYAGLSSAQRSELEHRMNDVVKAQFYHMYNCLWQMTDIQQLEYLTQQSHNGLYSQIGNFALRYYGRQ
ncbi:MAG: hypothetical protein LLG09_05495 [Negativicutes bacterium]|nr:hypothetical protein [Negativicutes bacterium]